MNLKDIANIRLISQQIEEPIFVNVKDIVGWMGGIQAQDYAMSKWAIGLRLPNSTDLVVETAINKGEIIRTHLFRPTWHFVSADDVYWMLELTAPQIKASIKSRHKQLGLSETIFLKSNRIIENALRGGQFLLREELLAELGKAKFVLNENRASHLLLQAELDGIVCSGGIKGGKQTYALLEERVPRKKPLTKEDALAKLAKKYFASHCPATLQDFIWWSGLTVSDSKIALEMANPDLFSEKIDSKTYWFTNSYHNPRTTIEAVHLLPAFDEFIISYTDRSASLPFEGRIKTVSNNGIFKPVIVVNGQVIGIWKRMIKKDKVIVEIDSFKQPDKTTQRLIEEASLLYGNFLGKKTDIVYRIRGPA